MEQATPNLSSRDFETTSRFYSRFGFAQGWRDDDWMLLTRKGLTLKVFPYPELNPAESLFSCCLRLDNVSAFYDFCSEAGVPKQCWRQPRVQPPKEDESVVTTAALVDPDRTLVCLIQN